MGRFRFSITAFVVLLSLACGGLAAIVSRSPQAANTAYMVFVALLCLSIVGALKGNDTSRLFWLGFALFGWMYWFCEFDVAVTTANRPMIYSGAWIYSPPSARERHFVTTDLLNLLRDSLSRQPVVGDHVMAQWNGGSFFPGTLIAADAGDQNLQVKWDDGSTPTWVARNQIAQTIGPGLADHALMGGLFALAGGVLASLIFGERNKPQP